ncbi:hypothetical protein Tco_0538679 [Tanacetum coccineum]
MVNMVKCSYALGQDAARSRVLMDALMLGGQPEKTVAENQALQTGGGFDEEETLGFTCVQWRRKDEMVVRRFGFKKYER